MDNCRGLQSRERPTVLIVDDVDVNLVFLQEIILQLGYDALTALSVREAIEKIKQKKPQLILLDIIMPEMDGFQFCELLKKNVYTKDIPVVFVSAANEMKDRERAAALGAVDYILKPFLFEEVKMRVETHLKIYKMQHELEMQNRRLNELVAEQADRIASDHRRIASMLMHMAQEAEALKNRSHIQNVSTNVRLLAQALNFSPKYENQIKVKFIDFLGNAAVLHDAGALCLKYEIVQNENRTTEEEEVYRTHTTIGARYLEEIRQSDSDNLEFLYAEVALNHHENWDGTGYPNQLAGEEIPLSARIFRVVDYYDELVFSANTGKIREEDIMTLMEEKRGAYFEPEILSVFFTIKKRLLPLSGERGAI